MITAPKGTKDVTPALAHRWHYIEQTVRTVAERFCIREIRTPTFESTELFLRGVGDTTDIVNKEMYTFEDKGGRSVTLKPEGTAGVARAFVENALYAEAQPTKMYYITPVFRYERPQAGRLREHHQFGVEYFGSYSPYADVEVMCVAKSVFDALGVDKLSLRVNNIGCGTCRRDYNAALKAYFAARLEEMCPTCRERFEKNPLRILDCKEPRCKAITAEAPVVLDYLCDDCRAHHETVCGALDALGADYVVDPRIVRGLDYYTGTVFEYVSENIGAQGTVCGGGRYNNLVEEVGGKPAPAVGFGMGLERLLLLLDSLGLGTGESPAPDVYLASMGDAARRYTTTLAQRLRAAGLRTETDLAERSLKAQLKYADKLAARYAIVVGDTEIAQRRFKVKNMRTGEEREAAEADLFAALAPSEE